MEISLNSPTNPLFPPAANFLTVRPAGFDGNKIRYYYEVQLRILSRAEVSSYTAEGGIVIPAIPAVYTYRTLSQGEVEMTKEQFDAWEAGIGGNDEYQLSCILTNLGLSALS